MLQLKLLKGMLGMGAFRIAMQFNKQLLRAKYFCFYITLWLLYYVDHEGSTVNFIIQFNITMDIKILETRVILAKKES